MATLGATRAEDAAFGETSPGRQEMISPSPTILLETRWAFVTLAESGV